MKRTKIIAESVIGKSLSYYRNSANGTLIKGNSIMPFDEKIISDV